MPATKPLKVPLVEIRDGVDRNPHVEQVDLQQQSSDGYPPAAWWSPLPPGSFTRG